MMSYPLDKVETTPTRINFDDVSLEQIEKILSTGSLDALPEAERRYYELMEMVRGLRARLTANNKVVTRAGIIRLLKSSPYHLSDWMARRVYTDAVNFFWAQDDVRPRAFSHLYAERCENWANVLFLQGEYKEARQYLTLAAKLRGCFEEEAPTIPEEVLDAKTTIIYTTDRRDLGVPDIDRRELEKFIDAIPDVPQIVRDNLKEDARIKKFDLKKRMLHDAKEFAEDTSAE